VKKVCMIGIGYIGLPTALVAAEHGYMVIGYDIDVERVERINRCEPMMSEPELGNKLRELIYAAAFRAQTTMEAADCFVIAVPTPFHENKKADLSHVYAAAESIARVLKKGDVIILESTVPVGTTAALAKFFEEKTGLVAGKDFFCAHCPERVLPGKIFYELVYNSRIIGGINEASSQAAASFYSRFVKAQLYLTNAATAEMVKLVENSARDVQIAFANEVAAMATAANIDPYSVITLANKHPRVNILQPRCGVGGHCIAVDPWFLIESFPKEAKLLRAAREINDNKPAAVYKKIVERAKQIGKKRTACRVLLLGATYKPDIEDLRESPAVFIARQCLNNSDLDVRLCDPYVRAGNPALPELMSLEQGIAWADLIVCLVSHTAFRAQVPALFEHPQLLDFCGLLYKNNYEEPLFLAAETLDAEDMFEEMVAASMEDKLSSDVE
jgi:UDP-N-acetyl-D-mannosaminuronic acid dehydrogenase